MFAFSCVTSKQDINCPIFKTSNELKIKCNIRSENEESLLFRTFLTYTNIVDPYKFPHLPINLIQMMESLLYEAGAYGFNLENSFFIV